MKRFSQAIIIILIGIAQNVSAQSELQITQISDLIISVRLNRGDVFYPKKFDKYKSVFERYKIKRENENLSEADLSKLEELKNNLNALNKQAELIKPYFTLLLEARDDALANGAMDFAPQTFQTAEEGLLKLVGKFSNKVPNNSENRINEVLNKYRRALFEAIRNNLLSEVRILIKESEDLDAQKYAPKTYHLVKNLMEEVDLILKNQEFENPELKTKVTQLSEESLHLLNIVQLAQKIKSRDEAFEEYLIEIEDELRLVSEPTSFKPKFSQGLKSTIDHLGSSIQEQQELQEYLSERVQMLSDSLKKLQQENRKLKGNLRTREDIKKDLQTLSQELTPLGVKILPDNNHVVLRLNGIKFDFGKIQINERSKSILERIGQTIRSMPAKKILISLGQSAGGNFQYSKSLAEQRAEAVALVIQTSSFYPDQKISSEGVIINSSLDTGHAVVDIILDWN